MPATSVRPRTRNYSAVMNRVCNTPWQAMEETLQAMCEILDRRLIGSDFTDAEIRARISDRRGSYLSHLQSIGLDGGESGNEMQIVDGVAVIPVYGLLAPTMSFEMEISGGTSTRQLIQELQSAEQNKDVRQILLAVDSPGGDAHGNAEVAQEMRRIRSSKPITAVIEGLGASAAYFIAANATEIVASPSAEVGSIGTYYVHRETTKAADQQGVKFTVFRAGENKNLANQHEALTDKATADLNARLTALNDQFLANVAEGRGVSVQTVVENFGNGRVMLAEKAKQAGLIDRIGTLQHVLDELRAKAGTTAPANRKAVVSVTHAMGESRMNPLLKQTAIAAGLCAADASDDVAQAAICGWFRGKVPTDPKQAAAQILAGDTAAPAVVTTGTEQAAKTTVTAPTDMISASANRNRISEIRATAALMGIADASLIQAATDDVTMSVEDARTAFTAHKAKAEKGVTITPLASEDDKFFTAAVDGLTYRAKVAAAEQTGEDVKRPSRDAMAVANQRALDLGKHMLMGTVGRGVFTMSDEEIAVAMLKGDGAEYNCRNDGFRSEATTISPVNFPNILSAVMGKMLDETAVPIETSYDFYATRLDSVPDFNPRTMLDTGMFGEFDEMTDGEKEKERKFSELAHWLVVKEFGMSIKATPQLLINDNLGVVLRAPSKFMLSWEETKNRLALDRLVTGKCSDGVSLFDSAHSNVLSAGAPSTSQLSAARKKLRTARDIGNKSPLRLKLDRMLVPTALLDTTEKLLSEKVTVMPTATADGNAWRGAVSYRDEPLLDDVSEAAYYLFANPALIASVAYAYLRGTENLARRLYYENDTRSRVFAVNGTFGALAYKYQAAVQVPAA